MFFARHGKDLCSSFRTNEIKYARASAPIMLLHMLKQQQIFCPAICVDYHLNYI
jgi:hypothetical protein